MLKTATSPAGCEIEYTLHLTVGELYDVDMNETLCAGGSITIGNNTYTEAGTYTDVLSTALGCDSVINLTLSVLDPIEVTDIVTDAAGGTNGSIDITVSGGMPPYSFSWNIGANTEDINGLGIGDYTVLITDANGCTFTSSYTVDQSNSTFEVGANIDVKIFPNPAPVGGLVNLAFSINESQTLTIRLYNSVGQLISSEQVDFLSGQTLHQIQLPPVQGMYHLHLQTEDGKHQSIQLSAK